MSEPRKMKSPLEIENPWFGHRAKISFYRTQVGRILQKESILSSGATLHQELQHYEDFDLIEIEKVVDKGESDE